MDLLLSLDHIKDHENSWIYASHIGEEDSDNKYIFRF
jgi:hypothetical protein